MDRQWLFGALLEDHDGEEEERYRAFVADLTLEERTDYTRIYSAYSRLSETSPWDADEMQRDFNIVYKRRQGGKGTPEHYEAVRVVAEASRVLAAAIRNLAKVGGAEEHRVALLRALASTTGVKVDLECEVHKEEVEALGEWID